jgi:hypothetical protein
MALRVFTAVKQDRQDTRWNAFSSDFASFKKACGRNRPHHIDGPAYSVEGHSLHLLRASWRSAGFSLPAGGGHLFGGQLFASRICKQPVQASRDVLEVEPCRGSPSGSQPDLCRAQSFECGRNIFCRLQKCVNSGEEFRANSRDGPLQPDLGHARNLNRAPNQAVPMSVYRGDEPWTTVGTRMACPG